MRYEKLIFGLSLSVCLIVPFEALQQPLLCSQCVCEPSNGSLLRVNCSSVIGINFFIDEKETNTSFATDSMVQQLSIRNNKYATLKGFFRYENLALLDLSNNKIEQIANNVFKKLQKLETLILSYNNIESLKPDVFQGEYAAGDYLALRSLRTIFLDHNNLQSLDPDLFEHTERIESLSLAHNPLKVIDTPTATAITNLVHLKLLDLSFTQISSLPAYFLHTPKNITVFNLSGNAFTEVPQQLSEAQSLETFVFNDNPLIINLTKANGFPEIPTLRILHLCEMPELTSIGPSAMANLTNLEELYLAGNSKLSRIDEGALASSDKTGTYEVWPSIKKLYLNDNQLSYINKSLLARWDTLAELDLLNNPWTCECENQWMVETLMPIYLEIDDDKAKKLKCAAPIEMVSFTFEQLYQKNSHMRCLDLYGAEPEKDAALLVGMLAGVLVGIPIALFFLYSYKRHWFGIFDDSPAAFSRRFYNKTSDVYEY